MKLRALSIERLAGLRSGLRLDPEHLTGRVRVLHGPNGVGKSSIVRALQALLWPNAAPTQGHVELEARFELAGIEWTVRRDGAITRWMRDGNVVDAPPLPPWEHANQLLVGLEDLGLGTEGRIQEHVQRELGGGYDIAAVEEEFRPSLQAGRVEANALRGAEDALRRARDAQAVVVEEWATLETQRHERDAASVARDQVKSLEGALALAHAQRTSLRTRSVLDAFPQGMDHLRDTEAEDLDGIRTRLAEALEVVASARAKESRLEREILELGLGEPVPPELLDELNERVGELRDADAELREAEKRATVAKSRTAAAADIFGPGADLERLARLDEGLDAVVAEFVRDAAALTERRSQVQARLGAIGDGAHVEPPEARAVAALEDWIATPDALRADTRPRKVLLALAAVLLALALGLAVINVWFLTIAILAVAAMFGARASAPPSGSTRADHEADYARTHESQPVTWTRDGVSTRLDEMRTRQARAKDAAVQAERRRELDGLLARVDADAAELGRRREGLAGLMGTTITAPEGLLSATLRARQELRDARNELRASEEFLEVKARARTDVLVKLNDSLRSRGLTAVADHASAKACVVGLGRTSGHLVLVRKDLGTEVDRARTASNAAERCRREIAALFQRNGLESTDETELGRRIERLGEWKAAREAHNAAERDVELMARNVPAELASATVERIEAQLTAARGLAANAAEFEKRVTQVETRLAGAQSGRALEDAQAERDVRRAALLAEFARAQRGEIARALLADVRALHDDSSRPRLVSAADRLLSRFTGGRYGLRTVKLDGKVEFHAHDNENASRTLALDELSDGTRAQLLLAARIAYLREIEHGNPMPVVLDDALATSDPERIQHIGAALLAVARAEDRQFLVLTKDTSDVTLLRPKDAQPGEVDATDLAEIQRLRAPSATHGQLRMPDVVRVPDSAGRTAEEYAAALLAAGLQVRPIDPYQPVDEMHLWWVLHHELELLERMLAHRLDSVGKMRSSAHFGLTFFDAREQAAAEPWVAIAASVLEAWRVGRGRPIDRDILERAGVSDTFLERMSTLATLVRGSAKAWIAAVRDGHELAKGYRSKVIEANHDFLVGEGYLDEREVLGREEAWMHVLAAQSTRPEFDDHALRVRFELLWDACGS